MEDDHQRDTAIAILDRSENQPSSSDATRHSDTVSCSNCAEEILINDAREIKRGDHISMPGQMNCKRQCCGKRRIIYKHHCIVTEVITSDKDKATVRVIHNMPEEKCMSRSIKEEEITFDLNLEDYYRVMYPHPRYKPDDIVSRAERKKEDGSSYCLCLNNCEHFATDCVVGKKSSLQIQNCCTCFPECFMNKICSPVLFVLRMIFRFFINIADEVAADLTNDQIDAKNRKLEKQLRISTIVMIVTVVLYIMYCAFWTFCEYRMKQNKHMCWSCFKTNCIKRWLTFFIFVVTAVSSLGVIYGLDKLDKNKLNVSSEKQVNDVKIAITVTWGVICVILQMLIPWIVLRCCFSD